MIDELKPYPEYKDSGLPWLGKAPAHWPTRRMKVLFKERAEKGFPYEPLLAATQTKGVVRKEEYGERTVTASKDFHLLKLVEPDDFVISLRSFQGGIEYSQCRGIISPAYTVLTPRPGTTRGYYGYFLKSKPFVDSLTIFVTGIREGQNIEYPRLARAYMPCPPPDEQAAIVRFLDYANGKIERAIRAKRKLIGLLNEQKQAIIHRAVTRGLDPNVKLKPSGIPWLGDVPEHWDYRMFGRLARVVRGASPRPSGDRRYYFGDYIPWVTVGEVTKDSNVFLTETTTKLTKLGESHSVRFAAGTLVITNSGATLGVPKILAVDACANDGIVAFLKLESILEKVFVHYFLTSLTKRLRDEMRQGGTQPNLNTGMIRAITCPIPPLQDQKKIIEFLEHELPSILGVVSRTESEIRLLREYRTSLTAQVVTGKVDVREAAKRLPDQAVEPLPLDESMEELIDAEIAEEVEA